MRSSAQDSPSLVRAVFKDAACSFNLRSQATLAELAEELAYFGQRHGGTPLYVDVRLGCRHAPAIGG